MSEEHKKLYNFFLSGAKISSNRKPENIKKEIRYSLSLMENVKLVSGDSLQWVTRRTVDGVNYVITKQAREYEEDGISISPKPEYFIAIEAPEEKVEKPGKDEKELIQKRLKEIEEEGWFLIPAFCIVDPSPSYNMYQNLDECSLLVCSSGDWKGIAHYVESQSIPWEESQISLDKILTVAQHGDWESVVYNKKPGEATLGRLVGLEMASNPHEFKVISESTEPIFEDFGFDPGPIPYMGHQHSTAWGDYVDGVCLRAGATQVNPGGANPTWSDWYSENILNGPLDSIDYYLDTYKITNQVDECNYSWITKTRFFAYGGQCMRDARHLFADYIIGSLKDSNRRTGRVWSGIGGSGCFETVYYHDDYFIDFWEEAKYPVAQTRKVVETQRWHTSLVNSEESVVYDESYITNEREISFQIDQETCISGSRQNEIQRYYGRSLSAISLRNHSNTNNGGMVERKMGKEHEGMGREYEENEVFFMLYQESAPSTEIKWSCTPWRLSDWGYDSKGRFYNGDYLNCTSNREDMVDAETIKLWANVMGERVLLEEVEQNNADWWDYQYFYEAGCCGVYDFFGVPVFVYGYKLTREYWADGGEGEYRFEVMRTKYGYFLGSHEAHFQSEEFPSSFIDIDGYETHWHDIQISAENGEEQGCIEKYNLYGSGVATVVAYNIKKRKIFKI